MKNKKLKKMKNETLNDYEMGELHILNQIESTVTRWLNAEKTRTCEELLQRFEQGSFENLKGRYDTYKVLLNQIKKIKEQLKNK